MEYRKLQFTQLKKISDSMEGCPIYLFNAERFTKNFTDLQNEFRKIYPNTRIAYSYKTNFVPGIGEMVKHLGGYAEVVSSMEFDIAMRAASSDPERIIYNGLLQDECMLALLKCGGKVNVESMECLEYVLKNASREAKIGIRIGDTDSRFGFQESDLFDVLARIIATEKKVAGIHCHVGGSRSLEAWRKKTQRMLRIAKDIEKILKYPLKYIDLGGHLYGRMDRELEKQFGDDIPTFQDYAETVATMVRDAYQEKESMPQLILEPGTALVADAVDILATVQNVKRRKGKSVATLNVSSYDCGMIADYKDLTIDNISISDTKDSDLAVICGYTCMEEDYINRNYHGTLKTGDDVLIRNCGAYSVSMKGDFIFPSIGMVKVNDSYEILEVMKEPDQSRDVVERCMVGGKRCAI